MEVSNEEGHPSIISFFLGKWEISQTCSDRRSLGYQKFGPIQTQIQSTESSENRTEADFIYSLVRLYFLSLTYLVKAAVISTE